MALASMSSGDPVNPNQSRETPDFPVPAPELVALLYTELRNLAASRIRSERPDHTLTATALVHEAYLRLSRQPSAWHSKAEFFSAAANCMSKILIDHHRGRAALKRGGDRDRVEHEGLEAFLTAPELERVDIESLDAAIETLRKVDPEAHRVVMLRYFAGLSLEDIAELMGRNERTIKRLWTAARAWLYQKLEPDGPAGRTPTAQ